MPGGTITPCQSCKRPLIFGQVCVCGWNTCLDARQLTAEEIANKECQGGHRSHYISTDGSWWMGIRKFSDDGVRCIRRW